MELFIIVSIIIALVFMYRSAKARERIANAVESYVDDCQYQREEAIQHKKNKEFLLEFPEAAKLPLKERQEQYREWLMNKTVSG